MSFFLPTVALKRVTDISEELLNSLGIRAVFLDVDNTLSTHGSQSPFEGSVAWAQNLVEHPQAVDVQETETDGNVVLELRVDPSDMGKVIGRQGRIAKEIRTLMKAAGNRENKRVTVDILD